MAVQFPYIEKTAFLEKIRSRYTDFEQLLSPLSEEQMTTSGVSNGWSIKDVLAHLTAWHYVLLERLQAAISGSTPPVHEEEDVDITNKRFFEANKDRSLADVMADFRNTHQQIVQAVEQLSNDDLNYPHRYTWWEGEPFWPNIAGDTYDHIDEHIEPVQAWIAVHRKQ